MTRIHKLRISPRATIVELRSCVKGKKRTKVLIRSPISSRLDFDEVGVGNVGTIDYFGSSQLEVIGW